jgi:hypothetical protein
MSVSKNQEWLHFHFDGRPESDILVLQLPEGEID